MLIVFNISAFLQALVIAIVMVILYFLNLEGLFNYLGIHDHVGIAMLIYLSFLIIVPMHRSGIKGHVFFIPTWLICLLLPLLLTMGAGGLMFWGCFFISALFFYRFIAKNDLIFRATFQHVNSNLQQLRHINTQTHEGMLQFWQLAPQTFLYPSNAFLYFNWAYRVVFPNSVSMDEFVNHYRTLVPLLMDNIQNPTYNATLNSFRHSLGFEPYSHPTGMLKKVAEIMNAYSDMAAKGVLV